MTDTIEALTSKLKEIGGNWAAYTALGSFALYVIGYLALRFHLTVLGVGTDLSVLDERYIFTGAKFLVFLSATIPIIVMIALAVALVLAVVVYLPYRLLPARNRESVDDKLRRFGDWWATPSRPAVVGIVISVFLIQFVMRQCFRFGNLLLAPHLPEPGWLQRLLLSENDGPRSLYFSLLVAGVIITVWLLLAARSRNGQTPRSRFLNSLLAVLVLIQFLLLPVNYGMVIIDKLLPRVADLGGMVQLKEGQEGWLVWEGKDGLTYFVRSAEEKGTSRKLVTLPQKDVKKTEIIRYDPVLRCVFVGRCSE
jgi:hypothetical protein